MKYTIKQINEKNPQDTFFGMFYFRKVASLFSYFFARISITPNQISILSLLFTLVGSYFFIKGTSIDFIIGAILIQFGMIMDYSDGQIARLKGLGTKRGAYFDVLVGMIQNNILVIAVTLGLYKYLGDINIWLIGFAVLFAWNMTAFVHLNYMLFFPNKALKDSSIGKKVKKKYYLKPQFFSIGSDVYFVLIGLGSLVSLLKESLILLAILGNIYWMTIFIFILKNNKQ